MNNTVNDNQKNRDKIYSRIKLRLSIFEIILNFVILGILAFSGISKYLVESVSVYSQSDYIIFLLFMAITGLIFSVIGIPIDFYEGYIVEHRFGLSNQSVIKWALNKLKSALLSMVIGIPIALVFFYFLKVSGDLWWLYFSLVLFFLTVLLARVAPIVIFPIFYKFKELENSEIKDKISSLLSDRQISIKGIYSFNMSKDTKKANAGFTGIGKSKRIILSDTLIEQFTSDEIAVIFAHEMGHYKKKHILKNIILSTILIFLSFYICGTIYKWTLSSFNFNHIYDIAALPILMLYLSILSFLLMPLMNFISRHYEREADQYALEITGDKNSFISSMEKLSEINLSDKEPHPATEFFFYSHPSIKKRLEFAENFRRSTE